MSFLGLVLVAVAIYLGLDNLTVGLINEWRRVEKERKYGKDKKNAS